MALTEDVICFGQTMAKLAVQYSKELKKTKSVENYEMLCKILICQIIALNARRPLEAAKIPLEFFTDRANNVVPHEELLSVLKPDEIEAYKALSEFYVPGKREQECSILMTPEMETNIEFIVSCRDVFRIPSSNTLLFARPGLDTTFDGSAVMRELRKLCKLQEPKLITSTGLRKYSATMALLKGKDFTIYFSKYMSHTLDVHNKNYCFPLDIINRGMIGNFMLGLNKISTSTDGLKNNNKNDLDTPTTPSSDTQNIVSNMVENFEINKNTSINNHIVNSQENYSSHSLNLSDIENSGFSDDSDDSDYSKNKKKRKTRRKWSDDDKCIVLDEFAEYVRKNATPGIKKCNQFLKTNKQLCGRTGVQVILLIDNMNRNKTKLPEKYMYLKKDVNVLQ